MELTPEREAEIKETIWERMRARKGDHWVTENAAWLENQWEYASELGMIDPDVDWSQVPLGNE